MCFVHRSKGLNCAHLKAELLVGLGQPSANKMVKNDAHRAWHPNVRMNEIRMSAMNFLYSFHSSVFDRLARQGQCTFARLREYLVANQIYNKAGRFDRFESLFASKFLRGSRLLWSFRRTQRKPKQRVYSS